MTAEVKVTWAGTVKFTIAVEIEIKVGKTMLMARTDPVVLWRLTDLKTLGKGSTPVTMIFPEKV